MTREEFVVKAQQLADDFGALLDEFLEDKKHLYASPKSGDAKGNIIIAEISASYMNDDDDDKENLQKTLTSVEVYGGMRTVKYNKFHCTADIWEAWDV